jgi:hypothetical protein
MEAMNDNTYKDCINVMKRAIAEALYPEIKGRPTTDEEIDVLIGLNMRRDRIDWYEKLLKQCIDVTITDQVGKVVSKVRKGEGVDTIAVDSVLGTCDFTDIW